MPDFIVTLLPPRTYYIIVTTKSDQFSGLLITPVDSN